MKKQLLVLSALGLFIICTAGITSENGIAGKTNSPSEGNCTSCHSDFALNSGGGSIYLTSNMPNWTYVPGQTYTINCIVKKTGTPVHGFDLEILKGTTSSGTLVITNTTKTQLKNATVGGAVRVNVTHKFDGGFQNDSSVFTFNWTAPATNSGNLIIWYSGIAGNHNGNESGDYVYTGSKTIYSPSLTVTPTTLSPFTATLTVPSAAQSFTIKGAHLTDSVKITPRSEYKVSLTGTSNWLSKITLAKNASNSLPLTTIYVRYAPTTAGVDSGYVTCSSTNAISKKVKVKGTSTPRLASSDQALESREIVLAPNPVAGRLSILNIVSEGSLNVSIYDLAGNKMRTQNISSDDLITMDVSNLKNGVYICRIESGIGTIAKKFIKQ